MKKNLERYIFKNKIFSQEISELREKLLKKTKNESKEINYEISEEISYLIKKNKEKFEGIKKQIISNSNMNFKI